MKETERKGKKYKTNLQKTEAISSAIKKKKTNPWENGPALKVVAVLLLLLFWQLLAVLIDSRILLVGPIEVVARLLTIWKEADFWSGVLFSFGHISLGFLLGFWLGIVLAVLAAKFPALETVFWPWFATIKAVPVASFVVICLIWLSPLRLSVFISFLIVLPITYQNILEGLKSSDREMLEMAQVYHLSSRDTFRFIKLEAMKPGILSTVKITFGMAWKAGIAAEIIGTPSGSMGKLLYTSKIYLDTDDLLALTVVIVVLANLGTVLLLRGVSFCLGTASLGTVLLRREVSPVPLGTVPMIQLDSISKTYEEKPVIKDYTACLESGSCYVLMGPSGQGKTTLLRLLSRLEQPNEGRIAGLPEVVSYQFQEDRLCEQLTGLQNIRLVTDDSRAEELLDKLGLDGAKNRPVREYSGGMKRRTSLARALLFPGQLLLLDEPFTGLDAEAKKIAIEAVKMYANHRTMIIVTHEEEEAEAIGGSRLLIG